jgi:hypothetical protein
MTVGAGTIALRHVSLPSGRDTGTVNNSGTITMPAVQ